MSGAPNPTGGGAQRQPLPQKQPGAFQFVPMRSEKRQKYLKILVYGPAGSGKTTLAGSAANLGDDVLLITAEGGDVVFDKNPRITHPEHIDQMRVERIEQMQKVYEWLTIHCDARDAGDLERLRKLQNLAFFGDANITLEAAKAAAPDFEPERIRKYNTIIVDSLTDIEAQNMNHVLGQQDQGFQVGAEMDVAEFKHFRQNNNTIQALVRAFRNLKVHVIFICGQRYMQDERKQFHYSPWMTGQLSTQIQSFVDVVGYMVVSNSDPTKPDVRKLYVQPQAAVRFDAKCRIASLKVPFLEDPLFEDLLKAADYI